MQLELGGHTHARTHTEYHIKQCLRDKIRGLDEGGWVVSGEALTDMAALG